MKKNTVILISICDYSGAIKNDELIHFHQSIYKYMVKEFNHSVALIMKRNHISKYSPIHGTIYYFCSSGVHRG